jgi:3-deoxy-D-manno-octulosonic-acid transferase
MFWVYNLLLTLAAPFWVPWMLIRARRRGEQPNWKERCGDLPILPRKGERRLWLHAVSVGEVIAALPILREVRARDPELKIVLSVTTSSGHQTARDRAEGLFDHLVYFPIDVARFQLAALTRVAPETVAVMETELWFNFLWAAKAVGAHTLVVNARLSDRSFPRARRAAFFYRALLAHVDRVLAQSETDADRFRALGARSVEVFGNCKFDEALQGSDADPSALRAELGIPSDALVVVIGSTRGAEEEAFVLHALRALAPAPWIIHAPRHLERVTELAAAVRAAFGSVALRSRAETGPYLILDTYGELARLYAVADVAVIGGGFANLGGQNLIQALAHGKPVLHGPHMQNFRDVAALAAQAGATRVCATTDELRAVLATLLRSAAERERMGAAARQLAESSRGAAARYAEAMIEEDTSRSARGRRF